MSSGIYRRRYVLNILALSLSGLATLLGLTFLAWILWITLSRGISAFSAHLFTRITAYADQGGLANAIAGSLIIDLMAIAICAPIGAMFLAQGSFYEKCCACMSILLVWQLEVKVFCVFLV